MGALLSLKCLENGSGKMFLDPNNIGSLVISVILPQRHREEKNKKSPCLRVSVASIPFTEQRKIFFEFVFLY
jgi:hypothetical protein